MDKSIHVVIMAGGSGTRFWPYSRNAKPKQFLDIMGTGRSLLQSTYDRFLDYTTHDKIWVVSNEIYSEVIAEQLPELTSDQILLEPMKRNTAPCVAYAAYKIKQKDPDAVLAGTPSDAAIFDQSKYISTIEAAASSAASNDQLLTIGIKPHRPETGYGYIQFVEGDDDIKKVKTFTEKPSEELAKKFIESGDFVWNAGIFVWSVNSIISAFEKYQHELAVQFDKGANKFYTSEEGALIEGIYEMTKGISIDYAIMEKADNVHVVLGDFGWSDLGSWDALHELMDKDEHGNVSGQKSILYDCKDNFFKTSKGKLVVASDLEGYLVADFEDVLLICKKDDSTKFKNFVSEVRSEKGEKFV